jgi:uncharacterized membrane-anchored protein
MNAEILLDLPEPAFQQLQQTARAQNRSVAELVRELVLRGLPPLPALPPAIEEELAAFEHLSNDTLWLLAQSTLTADQQRTLADLNTKAQQVGLSAAEEQRRQALLDAYDQMLVRRAQAAALLQRRGHTSPFQPRYSA